MSHVAEGDLHAWLDGALSHEAPERAERIAAHLEACGDCRTRLERAREVRDRAEGLLAAAAPEDLGLPPFEEVAARARRQGSAGVAAEVAGAAGEGAGLPDAGAEESPGGTTPGRPRQMSPLRTLAWAASLLLGVGLGWAGRSAWDAGDRGGRLATAEPTPALEAAGAESGLGDRQEGVDADEAPRARVAAEAGDARPDVAAAEADAPAGRRELADRPVAEDVPAEQAARRAPQTQGLAAADRLAEAEGRAAPAAPKPEAERGAAGEVLERKAAPESVRSDVAIQPLGAAARAAEPGRDAARPGRDVEKRVWVPAGAADAARWVGASLLVVEDLPVEDRAVSTADGVPVTRVRQRLPSGDLLEVHLRPAPGARASLRRATEDAWTRIDGLEVRLRGPVAPDSLAVLLSRLRAPEP